MIAGTLRWSGVRKFPARMAVAGLQAGIARAAFGYARRPATTAIDVAGDSDE
ncbi:hypothetical protein [Pseudoxanthomonas wuyuanensis]